MVRPAALRANAGQAVEKLLEKVAVFGFDFLKLDTDSGAEAGGSDFSDGPEFLVLDPEGEPDRGALFERAGHFNEAAPQADVGDAAPDPAGIAGGVELHREGASAAGMLPAFVERSSTNEIFGAGGRQRKIPDDSFGLHVLQTGEVFLGCGCLSDPADLEPALRRAIDDTNHFTHFELGLDLDYHGAATADVHGKNVFVEGLARRVSSEDSDGDSDIFARFPAAYHGRYDDPLVG
jgi:hypothetical protein